MDVYNLQGQTRLLWLRAGQKTLGSVAQNGLFWGKIDYVTTIKTLCLPKIWSLIVWLASLHVLTLTSARVLTGWNHFLRNLRTLFCRLSKSQKVLLLLLPSQQFEMQHLPLLSCKQMFQYSPFSFKITQLEQSFRWVSGKSERWHFLANKQTKKQTNIRARANICVSSFDVQRILHSFICYTYVLHLMNHD